MITHLQFWNDTVTRVIIRPSFIDTYYLIIKNILELNELI